MVRGPDGQPIAGVNVVVKGTKKGVVTDAYGGFSIEVEQGKTLVISNIGYNPREIKVNGENNIIVGLEISTSKLDEVQIIAYGTTSQRFQTGNVASDNPCLSRSSFNKRRRRYCAWNKWNLASARVTPAMVRQTHQQR